MDMEYHDILKLYFCLNLYFFTKLLNYDNYLQNNFQYNMILLYLINNLIILNEKMNYFIKKKGFKKLNNKNINE